jgi:hypothetical protein
MNVICAFCDIPCWSLETKKDCGVCKKNLNWCGNSCLFKCKQCNDQPQIEQLNDFQITDLFMASRVNNCQSFNSNYTIISNVCKALEKNELVLNPIYLDFCRIKSVKQIALRSFQSGMKKLKEMYKSTKASVLDNLKINKISSSNEVVKTWNSNVIRLFGPDRDKQHYSVEPNSPLANKYHFMVDMGNANWFYCMVYLSTIRKILSQRNKITGQGVRHLTQLNINNFYLLIFNEKNQNKGTTRMILPIRNQELFKQEKFIRVLDMTYGEIYQLIRQIFLGDLKLKDQQLATMILKLLDKDQETIQFLESKQHLLGDQFCSFLCNAELLENGGFKLNENWFIQKKSRSPKGLNQYQVKISAYETISYIMSVLFLAEPRHALGMWHSTVLAIKLIESGHLKFWQLFSTLDGAIKYGRLLPGANTLKKALSYESDVNKFIKPTVSSSTTLSSSSQTFISTSQTFQNQIVPNLIQPCEQPKRLAMPLVDSVLFIEPEKVFFNYMDAIQGDGCRPIYQPLIKCLFIEYLWLIVSNKTHIYSRNQSIEDLIHNSKGFLYIEPPKQQFVEGRKRTSEDDKLPAPQGFVGWGVINDANSLFRVLALALDFDEHCHGAFRTKLAEYFIKEFKESQLLKAPNDWLLFSQVAELNLNPKSLPEIYQIVQSYNDQASKTVLVNCTTNMPANIPAIFSFLADVNKLKIIIWNVGTKQIEKYEGKNFTETIYIAFRKGANLGENYFYLLREVGRSLNKPMITIVDSSSSTAINNNTMLESPNNVPELNGEFEYDDDNQEF